MPPNQLVKIERANIDPNLMHGVVVARSASLLLIHQEYDFQFDGYCVVREKDVTHCVSSETNDHTRRLMVKEGLWKRPASWVRRLSVEGWPELLAGLEGRVVSIEDEVNDDFQFGPIAGVHARHAEIRYHDACGRFRGVEKVSYSRITKVSFGNRYSTILGKYLGNGDPPVPGVKLHRP